MVRCWIFYHGYRGSSYKTKPRATTGIRPADLPGPRYRSRLRFAADGSGIIMLAQKPKFGFETTASGLNKSEWRRECERSYSRNGIRRRSIATSAIRLKKP